MVPGVSRTEMETDFADQEFTLDNFHLFAERIDSNLSDTEVTLAFTSLEERNIDSFADAFDALDIQEGSDGTVTSEEILHACATCQTDSYSAQIDQMSGEGDAVSADAKDEIMTSYDTSNNTDVFGDSAATLSDPDRAYLQEINIFSGLGEYDDEAKEAFRLIVDMYANDSDFRDLIQYYIDTKGVGPTITMGEVSSTDSSADLFGIGAVDGTESIIDISNISSTNPEDKRRAQETIAHELMHNLGLGHETEDEEASFDTELGLMYDMDVEGTSRSSGRPWSGYATNKTNEMPILTETE